VDLVSGTATSKEAEQLQREVNEFGARMVSDHPSRFGFYASVPLPDTDGSLRELDYALNTLKADGILLWSNFDGRFLGDPGFGAGAGGVESAQGRGLCPSESD